MPVRYCSSKLKVGPIKSYLAAVHNLHVTQGIPGAPLDRNPMLALVLQEIERKQAKQERNREDARQPKTPALLRVLRADWNEQLGHYEATLLWTAACAGFFACLCRVHRGVVGRVQSGKALNGDGRRRQQSGS